MKSLSLALEPILKALPFSRTEVAGLKDLTIQVLFAIVFPKERGVAQSGSAPQWGCGGRRFKSSHPDCMKGGKFVHKTASRLVLYYLIKSTLLQFSEMRAKLRAKRQMRAKSF